MSLQGTGTLLAQGVFRVVIATPLCHPQTSTVGRDIKFVCQGSGNVLWLQQCSLAWILAGYLIHLPSKGRTSSTCIPYLLSRKPPTQHFCCSEDWDEGQNTSCRELTHLVLTHLALPQSQQFGQAVFQAWVQWKTVSNPAVQSLLSCLVLPKCGVWQEKQSLRATTVVQNLPHVTTAIFHAERENLARKSNCPSHPIPVAFPL